jgi:hypothetical protein
MAALPALLRAGGLAVTVTTRKLAEVPVNTGVVVLRTGISPDVLAELRVDTILDRKVAVVVIDDTYGANKLLPIEYVAGSTRAASRAAMTLDYPEGIGCGVDPEVLADATDDAPVRIPHGTMMRTASTAPILRSLSAHPVALAPLLVDADTLESSNTAFAFSGWREERDQNELEGCLFLFASDSLFTNASLANAPNASLVAAFFAALVPAGQQVVFLDMLDPHGHASSGMARAVNASHLLPFLAQAALFLIALMIAVGAAFGPLRDPIAIRHKAFVEHIEAVGQRYASLGRPGRAHAAWALGKLLMMRHRHQLRGTDASSVALARLLAEKSGLEETQVRQALALAESDAEIPTEGGLPTEAAVLETLSTLAAGRGSASGVRRTRR